LPPTTSPGLIIRTANPTLVSGVRLVWTRVVTLYAALVIPSAVLAQSESDTAAARALFSEGRALADAGDWDQAADRFRRALALRPSPPIRYNLAVALEHQGALVEASEQLRAAIREAPADDRTRTSADTLLRRVEPRIGRLTVRIEGDATDMEVLLDGRRLAPALVGVGAPTDPGHHRVVARRGGVETSAEGDLEPGDAAVITVAAPTSAGAPIVSPPPGETAAPDDGDDAAPAAALAPPETREPEAGGPDWMLVSFGGVAVVGGLVLDLVPHSAKNHEFDALDLAPVVLYAGGAALLALGIL